MSLHAVLVLPALALLLSRTRLTAPATTRVLRTATACYALAVAATAVWAVLTYR